MSAIHNMLQDKCLRVEFVRLSLQDSRIGLQIKPIIEVSFKIPLKIRLDKRLAKR